MVTGLPLSLMGGNLCAATKFLYPQIRANLCLTVSAQSDAVHPPLQRWVQLT